LSAADRVEELDPEDLQLLAEAAKLTGREADSMDILARAHQGFVSIGDFPRAARCAIWLGFSALLNSEFAQAGGWVARARRLLEGRQECVEQGYLLLPAGLRSLFDGDVAGAHAAYVQAAVIGERFGDKDLVTFALNGQGRTLIRQGEIAAGVSLLDEAMVAVASGEVSPIVAGSVYCSVIESCRETFDVRRAQEWTAALTEWCASQPELVPYRSRCLLHRAEILQMHGAWADALEEAHRALEQLSRPTSRSAAGAALYCIAELHRLRGDFAAAEEAYGQARQWQASPQPGLARLRLALGEIDAAHAIMRRALDEVHDPAGRCRVLDAYIETSLAANEMNSARKAVAELMEIAQRHKAPYLVALSAHASGAVLLAEHQVENSLSALRQAWTVWRELEAPYEGARTQVLIAAAFRESGDAASAAIELDTARETFRKLGAAADLACADALFNRPAVKVPGSLSAREVEVLRLVASGRTNRDIASELGISEKTVARHISNIFNKLDLSSRSAATAYAYENRLI
jgi:DNA-binding NarL/FixJ family response regulator